MIIIILLLVVLGLILVGLWSQVKINQSTSEALDELSLSVDLATDATANLEHRVQRLERKSLSEDSSNA